MIRTERLVLRALDPDVDAESLHQGYTDADALRWWHEPLSDSVETTRARVAANVRDGYFAICLDVDAPAVGHVGWLGTGYGRRHGFGYFLRREHWGRGIAHEAASAALRHGFDVLGAAGAELWVYEGNARSAALAERLGCTLRGRFVAFNLARGSAFETRVYGVTASEAEAADPPPDPPRVLDLVPSFDVPDVGASIEFWRDRLGFEIEFAFGDPPSMVSLVRRDWTPLSATVRFRVADDRDGGSAGDRTAASGEPPLRGRLDVLVADVDVMYDDVRRRDAPIAVELATQPWGLREFVVDDPNGIRVRFYAPAV